MLEYFHRQYLALLADMGTGKTWLIINNAALLWTMQECDALLVLAPNGVHANWVQVEIPKHMPDEVSYQAEQWASGMGKQRSKDIESFLNSQDSGQLRILAMNWEALNTKKGFKCAETFLKSSTSAMIACDESDAVKNPGAGRTKKLMQLKPLSRWRRLLTGTMGVESPFDIYAQYNFLSMDILDCPSFYAFKSEYAEMLQPGHPLLAHIQQSMHVQRIPQIVAKGRGGLPKYRNLDKLRDLIEPHSFKLYEREELALPDRIYKTAVFDLTREQHRVYQIAKQECRLEFEGEITPFNKLARLIKLAQITSGYYLYPGAQKPVRIAGDNPKLDLMVERILKRVEAGEKVIVWARFRVEIADVVARLTGKCVLAEYHGGVRTKDRPGIIKEFETGSTQVFIGNQQAAGLGITLIAARNVFYFSNDFSLRNRLQSEKRAHRYGQKHNVIYTNMIAHNTVDQLVVDRLTGKLTTAQLLVNFEQHLRR